MEKRYGGRWRLTILDGFQACYVHVTAVRKKIDLVYIGLSCVAI